MRNQRQMRAHARVIMSATVPTTRPPEDPCSGRATTEPSHPRRGRTRRNRRQNVRGRLPRLHDVSGATAECPALGIGPSCPGPAPVVSRCQSGRMQLVRVTSRRIPTRVRSGALGGRESPPRPTAGTGRFFHSETLIGDNIHPSAGQRSTNEMSTKPAADSIGRVVS